MGGCPICGKLTDEDVDEFEAGEPDPDGPEAPDGPSDGGGEGGDGGDDHAPADDWKGGGGDAEEAPKAPQRRFSLDMLKPRTN
jgi:hypothetical protein